MCGLHLRLSVHLHQQDFCCAISPSCSAQCHAMPCNAMQCRAFSITAMPASGRSGCPWARRATLREPEQCYPWVIWSEGYKWLRTTSNIKQHVTWMVWDKVCVGRGESAGGVGVSAAAGCASRPAPSAVLAGAKCRVGRRQVPWRPAPGIPEGGTWVGRGASVSDRGAARAGLPLKRRKKIPALT